jgi:hypothetical protein
MENSRPWSLGKPEKKTLSSINIVLKVKIEEQLA